MRDYKAKMIIEKARGNWPNILELTGIEPSYLKNKHGPCPICGGKDRFRFDNKEGNGTFYCNKCGAGDGIQLLMFYHNCGFYAAIDATAQILNEQIHVKSYILNSNHANSVLKIPPLSNQKNIAKRYKSLITIWAQAKPVTTGDPVDCYLKARGISLYKVPSVIRYHHALPYYNDGVMTDKFPALLAKVENIHGNLVTIHRTYLGDGCKAKVAKPKKLMPAIKPGASLGGAIKLYQPLDGKLILAEGIETACSLYIATNLPVWSTINASGLENIILPSSITEITIAVDNDESNRGQEAASILTARLLLEGRKVKRVIPPKVGQDFNDLLLEGNL